MDMLPFGFYSVREIMRATDEDVKSQPYSVVGRIVSRTRKKISSARRNTARESTEGSKNGEPESKDRTEENTSSSTVVADADNSPILSDDFLPATSNNSLLAFSGDSQPVLSDESQPAPSDDSLPVSSDASLPVSSDDTLLVSSDGTVSVPYDGTPPPPEPGSSSSVHSKSPIFIISVLPQTCLPAHAFQQHLSPMSPHHYPAAPPHWPILSPPLGQFARNLYLKKYTRANYKYFNTYLPVVYNKEFNSIKLLSRKTEIHPCIHKLWRDLNDEDNSHRIRTQSLDSSDGSDILATDFHAESFTVSFYAAPKSSDENCDQNSLSSDSSCDTVIYNSGVHGGGDPSQIVSSAKLHKYFHDKTLFYSDSDIEFSNIQYRLAYELRVSTSTVCSLPAELFYTGFVCLGYFDECTCEEPLQQAPSEIPDDATPGEAKIAGTLLESKMKDDACDISTNEKENIDPNDESACVAPLVLGKSDHFSLNARKYVPAEPVPFDINLDQLTVSKLTSSSSTVSSLRTEVFSVPPATNISAEVNSQSSISVEDSTLVNTEGVESSAEALEGAPESGDAATASYLPAIRKKERDYMGMMDYDKRDEASIIKMLIYDLKPRVAVTLLPGLPAYILFMCIRHTDHINDDEKVRSLLNHTVTGIKRVMKKRHQDLDSTVLWLSNTLRLLHNLKQYSGDEAFQQDNTPKQNEQSLKNFDLSEYRQVLSDMGVWIYNGVIKLMEESIQPLVVPSILELEAISGLSGSKPGAMRGRKSSSSEESPEEPQKALDLLLSELTAFYRTLASFGTDPELISQVFRQIFYFICSGALNNLLLRKDMCHWSKGMQIRYNLSHLEQWTRDMRLPELCNTDALSPIIQAAQLLQARKTEDDVQSICDMCNKLTLPQVVKILNLYTPDDFEERLPASFIQKIQQRLLLRPNAEQEQNTLIMNTKFLYPVRFPFNPSSIRLEDVELAEVLNLSMLKKV